MKKLDGCSVTPTSTAKFDWSVGIFAKTVTQSELAANAAAKQANCQNFMPPAPWIFFFLQGSTRLASFFVAQRASVNYLSRYVAYLPQFLSAPIGRAAHPVTVWSLVTGNGTLPVCCRRRRQIAAEEFGAHDLAAARQQAGAR